MSLVLTRGPLANLESAAAGSTLIEGELRYLTDEKSVVVATGNDSFEAVGSGSGLEVGDLVRTAGLNYSYDPDYLLCRGQHVAQSEYPELFAKIGHRFFPVDRFPEFIPVKIADPSDLPASTGRGASWSPDGRYLAITHLSSPYVTIYDWSTGSPVKIANPSDLPTGTGYGASWSPDGRYLAITHSTTPFVTIYDWSTGVPVKIANPGTLPASNGNGVGWSPDGRYLAVGHELSPYVTIYDWSTGSPVKIANPSDLPTGNGRGANWSPDGRYLAIAHNSTPFVTIYDWSTGSPVKIANPSDLPANVGWGASWSPDGRYLAITHLSSPFVTIYDNDELSANTFYLPKVESRADAQDNKTFTYIKANEDIPPFFVVTLENIASALDGYLVSENKGSISNEPFSDFILTQFVIDDFDGITYINFDGNQLDVLEKFRYLEFRVPGGTNFIFGPFNWTFSGGETRTTTGRPPSFLSSIFQITFKRSR